MIKKFNAKNSYVSAINDLCDWISQEKEATQKEMVYALLSSRSSINNHLGDIRGMVAEFGVEVKHSRTKKAYRFTRKGNLQISILIEWTDRED
jgi:transcriptional antiterminator